MSEEQVEVQELKPEEVVPKKETKILANRVGGTKRFNSGSFVIYSFEGKLKKVPLEDSDLDSRTKSFDKKKFNSYSDY